MAPQKGKKSNEKSDCISAVTCQNHYYEKPESKDKILKFKKELDVICTEAPLTLNRINKEFKEITIITFRKHQGFKAKEDKLILAVEKKPCKKYNKQFQNEDDAKKRIKDLMSNISDCGENYFAVFEKMSKVLTKDGMGKFVSLLTKNLSGKFLDDDNIQYLFKGMPVFKIKVVDNKIEY